MVVDGLLVTIFHDCNRYVMVVDGLLVTISNEKGVPCLKQPPLTDKQNRKPTGQSVSYSSLSVASWHFCIGKLTFSSARPLF